MTVLIVDDDEIYLKLIKRQLKNVCERILTVENPLEVLDKVKSEKIDLIISDYNMAIMNGLELFLKINKYFKDLPFIIHTAVFDNKIKMDAIKKGVYAFYDKPSEEMISLDIEVLKKRDVCRNCQKFYENL
jgi:DNA-binding NtrC family response regulator